MDTEPVACKTPEDVKAMLEHLEAKYKDGADKMSLEEKKKHRDLLQHVLKMVGSMEAELRKSMDSSECMDKKCMVLQIKNLPSDGNGSFLIPNKEEIERIFLDDKYSPRKLEAVGRIEVESVFVECNYTFIPSGCKSPNFTTKFAEVFVKFASAEQASYVQILAEGKGSLPVNVKGKGAHHAFRIKFERCQETAARAAYRTIGDLIVRLKEVDNQLKALGAVPGRGGVPELSEMLVQSEDFDSALTSYGFDKATLHSYLCTRTRVDKRKRQASLEPLVDERIEILMQLAKMDQDKYPFTFEREFK